MKDDAISLFEKQAALLPEKVAVVRGEASISFGDLNKKANQLARLLLGKGITTDSIVAIVTDRSVEMIVAILGTLKAGGAYLPIDPRYPANRIRDILLDSGTPIVISQTKYSEMLAGLPADTNPEPFFLDGETTPFSEPESTNPDIPISPSSLAYIIYTSGSTGKPKGVMVEHSALNQMVEAFQSIAPTSTSDQCLSTASYAFDVSVYEFFTALPFGATLHLLDPDEIIDIVFFFNYLVNKQITSAYFPPALVAPLAGYLHKTNLNLPCRKILVGVEPLKQKTLDEIKKHLPDGIIINGYGVTEAAVCSTVYLFHTPDDPKKVTPIGKQLPGHVVVIVDESYQRVAPGESGQIIIGGKGVARGYLHNEPLTHEKFRKGIVPDYPEMRFYLTGDVATCLPDGNIEFIGRVDNQVKITGHRVETGEIESKLEEHPLVERAVVIALKDKHTNTFLKAFYTSSAKQPIPDLKRYLANHLPEYMIPAQFEFLVRFPQTVSQKIDRQKLAHQSTAATFAGLPHQPDDITGTLNGIFAAYLENPVETEKTLFEQGGDSVDVMNILLEIHHHFNLHIPVKTFYEHSSVSSLTGFITNALNKQTVPESGIKRSDRSGNRFPLTAIQQELFMLHKLDQTKIMHNILVAFEIKGDLDIAALGRALNSVIETNESFRSKFSEIEGLPVQSIERIAETPLSLLNLEFAPNQPETIQKLHTTLGRTILETDTPPLFRFQLVRYHAQQHFLYLLIHHIIFDGWSAGVFMHALQRCYEDIMTGRGCPEDPAKIDFTDYSNWYRNQLTSGKWSEDLAYWQEKLAHPPQPMRLSKTNAEDFDYSRAERKSWTIPMPLVIKAQESARAHNTSLFNVLLTVYQLLLWKMSGQTDFLIGTPYANRGVPGLRNVIGYMTNMVALRAGILPETTIHQLIRQADQASREAFTHANYPFGMVAKELGFSRPHVFNPMLYCMFIMQNWQTPFENNRLIGISQKELGNNTAKALFTMNAELRETLMECWFEYPLGLFSPGEPEQLSQDFLSLLDSVLATPEMQAGNLPRLRYRRKVLTAALMGEGNLLLRCATHLQAKGWSILLIVTNDQNIIAWANTTGIPVANPNRQGNLAQLLQGTDFLFSVNNPWITGDDVIGLKSLTAINYHDSLLPEYAGMFATNRSILNLETVHGITWHLMNHVIDAGDICLQVPCTIDRAETMQSLNLKCFELAMNGFVTLIEQIENGTLSPKAQELQKRTYFGKMNRPAGLCGIDFHQSATEIERLCRGTQAGDHHNNEFGVAHLFIGQQMFIAPEAQILPNGTTDAPGTILSTENNALIVASKDHPVRFNRIFSAEGAELNISDLAANNILKKGDIIQKPHSDLGPNELVPYLKNEQFWVKKLTTFTPISGKFCMVKEHGLAETSSFKIDLSKSELINKHGDQKTGLAENTWLTILFIFLEKLFDQKDFSVPVSFPLDLPLRVHPYVPIEFKPDENSGLSDQPEVTLQNPRSRTRFLRDVFYRYPALRKTNNGQQFSDSPLAVCFIKGKRECPPFYNATLHILVNLDESTLEIRSRNTENVLLSADFFGPRLAIFLANIAGNDLPVKSITLLTEQELSRFGHGMNFAPGMSAEETGILKIFHQKALLFPDKAAVQDESFVLSFKELDQISDTIAARLIQNGVVRNSYVGCLLKRSVNLIAAILGILKSGGIYVPLDPNAPGPRLDLIAEDAALGFVITESSGIPFARKIAHVINLADLTDDGNPPPPIGEVAADQRSPAYVIYTSGTSGRPKGVIISQSSLSSFIRNAIDRYEITHTDRILQFASPAFDASMEEIFTSICSGASLVIRTDEMAGSITTFIEEITKRNISVVDLPTAFWKQITDLMIADGLRFPESLRLMIIGGELANRETMLSWKRHFAKAPRLINTYGPTETTIVAASCYLDENRMDSAFPIGIPLGETKFYLVDNDLNPRPMGLPGQLLIGGPQVGSGYVNNPELTRRYFIENPFNKDEMIYATGDYAYQNEDNQLVFLGRTDHQIKLRGFRIETEEIDRKILETNGIKACLTILYKKQGTPMLVSYIIPRNQGAFPVEKLLQKLQGALPPYMVPSSITPIEKFPLTQNGKIDHAGFPEPDFNTLATPQEQFSPTESLVAGIFKKTLGIETCLRTTNFFQSGGDSLSALTLLSQIKGRTGRQLSIGEIYSGPGVFQIAGAIDRLSEKGRDNLQMAVGDRTSRYMVCLKRGGSPTPLVTVYFDAGNNHLPDLIPEDQPAYTLIPYGSDGEKITNKSVAGMARAYLPLLIQEFENRPIKLAGYSFGGLVAMELALQMRRRQMLVERLVLIDTVAPPTWKRLIHETSPGKKTGLFQNHLICNALAFLGKEIPLKRRNPYILYSWRKAAVSYHPDTEGKTLPFILIRSTNSLSGEPMLGWESDDRFQVTVITLDGDHHSIVRDRESLPGIIKHII